MTLVISGGHGPDADKGCSGAFAPAAAADSAIAAAVVRAADDHGRRPVVVDGHYDTDRDRQRCDPMAAAVAEVRPRRRGRRTVLGQRDRRRLLRQVVVSTDTYAAIARRIIRLHRFVIQLSTCTLISSLYRIHRFPKRHRGGYRL